MTHLVFVLSPSSLVIREKNGVEHRHVFTNDEGRRTKD